MPSESFYSQNRSWFFVRDLVPSRFFLFPEDGRSSALPFWRGYAEKPSYDLHFLVGVPIFLSTSRAFLFCYNE